MTKMKSFLNNPFVKAIVATIATIVSVLIICGIGIELIILASRNMTFAFTILGIFASVFIFYIYYSYYKTHP